MSEANRIVSEIKAHPLRGIWLLLILIGWELLKHDALSWADERARESVGMPLVMLPLKFLRFIAGWSVAHPVEVFLAFVGLFVLWVFGRAEVSARKWSERQRIDELRFDYLPRSPLENGWVIAYPKEPEGAEKWKAAKWSPALNAPRSGSLHMEVDAGCAIEHPLDPNKHQADRLRFLAKHTNDTMIFTYVRLTRENGPEAHRWIKYVVGTGKAHPTPKWEDVEWTLYLKGEPRKGGWREFDVSLQKAVEQTWAYYGWSFSGLLRVRLRGELSISPPGVLRVRAER